MMGAAQNLEHDGIYLSAEQWAEIQKALLKVARIEQVICKQSKLVGTIEAADMLDIHPNTLRTWHDEGKLPKNLGKGKHLKFERAAIERLVEALKTGRPRKA